MRLPELEAICLVCACSDPSNDAAQKLMIRAQATTATGVLAALFVTTGQQREELVLLARQAIAAQHDICPVGLPSAHELCPMREG